MLLKTIEQELAEAELAEAEALEAEALRHEQEIREKAKGNLLSWAKLHNPRYQAGWVHRDICRRLCRFSDEVAAGKSPRLILSMPPRHGKSEIVSRRFPAWHLGRNPHHDLILASYGAELAETLSSAARTCAVQSAPWWPTLAPAKKSWTISDWRLQAGGGLRAAGVGGPITGQGAHVAIIDDPIKDAEEAGSQRIKQKIVDWYTTTLYTRLAPGGGVLLTMTRWAEDDLAGWLLDHQKTGGDSWEIVRYPAIAEEDEYGENGKLVRREGEALHPERYDLAALLQRKAVLPAHQWAALYQQRPSPQEGAIFHRSWFNQRYSELPTLSQKVISCDLTFKGTSNADYVALQVWGRREASFYLIHQTRARMDYPSTRAAVLDLYRRHPDAVVLVEDKANGPALIADLKKVIPKLIPIDPGRTSKSERAQVASVPLYQAGNVWLPESAWIGDFIEEHIGFGAGAAHDDQIDAESQALQYLTRSTPPTGIDRLNAALSRSPLL